MTNTTDLARGLVNVIRESIVNQTGRDEGAATTRQAEALAQRIEGIAALDALSDLKDRCEGAVASLCDIDATGRDNREQGRLAGKTEGVKLALSYISEAIRGIER